VREQSKVGLNKQVFRYIKLPILLREFAPGAHPAEIRCSWWGPSCAVGTLGGLVVCVRETSPSCFPRALSLGAREEVLETGGHFRVLCTSSHYFLIRGISSSVIWPRTWDFSWWQAGCPVGEVHGPCVMFTSPLFLFPCCFSFWLCSCLIPIPGWPLSLGGGFPRHNISSIVFWLLLGWESTFTSLAGRPTSGIHLPTQLSLNRYQPPLRRSYPAEKLSNIGHERWIQLVFKSCLWNDKLMEESRPMVTLTKGYIEIVVWLLVQGRSLSMASSSGF